VSLAISGTQPHVGRIAVIHKFESDCTLESYQLTAVKFVMTVCTKICTNSVTTFLEELSPSLIGEQHACMDCTRADSNFFT
jgi:hypothetical protein